MANRPNSRKEISKDSEEYAGHKGPMPGMEVKTPYPKGAEIINNDLEYLGNKLADLADRVNEVELSISDLSSKILRVMGRMGLV